MSSKTFKSNGDEEFLRGWTESWIDIEETFDVSVSCFIIPTARKRVLQLHMTAVERSGPSEGSRVAGYIGEWPHASVQSFSAFLMQASYKLMRLVEDWWVDRAKEVAPPSKRG